MGVFPRVGKKRSIFSKHWKNGNLRCVKSIKPVLTDQSLSDLEALVKKWGLPAFRARQIYRQIYVNLVDSPAGMTDLPAELRDRLSAETSVTDLELAQVLTGDRDMTRKALFRLPGGAPLEAVLMIYPDRATVCVSTQSGCAIGCLFCATGRMKEVIPLTAGQMIEQVLWAARQLKATNQTHLTNVVYMGMGEAFLNYEAWWASVERLHDPKGFNMGVRSFTVSTVGIIPGIRRLAGEKLPINLAISLHAADNELRNQLVPVNKKYPLGPLMQAVREYTDKTSRRVSFEYVMLNGINDSADQALALANLLRGELCHVNLIPWNSIPGMPLQPSPRKQVLAFQKVLEQHHIACTLRVQRGVEIAAACGQLAGQQP